MKKFFKFGCLGIIGIIILAIVVAVMGGGDDSTSSDNENGGDSSESGNNFETEEQTYAIGDTAEVGSMTYTINGKSTADSVGPDMLTEEANGTYVVLDVTAVNNGNEAVTVDGTYFNLKQGEKTFEADSAASNSANQSEDGLAFFLEQLNPGSETNGKVVFDVAPEIAEADDLSVEVQEGMFGSVSKMVQLQ